MTTGGLLRNPKRSARVRFPFFVSNGCQQCTLATRTPRGRRTCAAASNTLGGLVALLLVTQDTNQAVPPKKISLTCSASSAGTKRIRGSTHSLAVRKKAAIAGPVMSTKKHILSQALQRCEFAGSSSQITVEPGVLFFEGGVCFAKWIKWHRIHITTTSPAWTIATWLRPSRSQTRSLCQHFENLVGERHWPKSSPLGQSSGRWIGS